MNNNSEEKIVHAAPVPPFVTFVTSAVPMVFDNSMSYYEALCALWKWLQDDVIDVINNNASVTELWRAELTEFEEDMTQQMEDFDELMTGKFDDLKDAFDTLQSWIEHYFDNLDVQEEINNKLDAMVQAGTLQEIIAQYIQANTAWCFDTVADMKVAENFINGSFAQTLGYNSKNDGGAALYKIRTITNDDVVDEATIIELADDSLIAELIIPDEITPQLFGCVGDGTTDDTANLRKALKYCIDHSKVLHIHKPYYITTSLLASTDYATAELHIKGDYTKNSYSVNDYGGIKFANGINVFDGLTVKGVIDGVVFAPVSRTQTGSIFNSCTLSTFSFINCYVANILAFLHNTGVNQVSKIKSSNFYTVYYFAKCDSTSKYELTDSCIEDCYINGGEEMNDNSCFQFASWNGCSVRNNFIDYYRTIYEPYSPSGVNTSCELPNSINNQYQVFRYLYWKNTNISSIVFNSVSDVFNWNDPTKLTKLNNFQTLTYVGQDTQTHDIPPYIGYVDPSCLVSIKDAYLQDNLNNIIFVKRSLTEYNYGRFSLTCNGLSVYNKYTYHVTHADSIYNGGNFKGNLVDIPFAKSESSLPSVPSMGWSNYYLGQRINVNNAIYRLEYSFTDSAAHWVEDHSL